MYKILSVLFAFMVFVPCANAFNVLQENQKYKQELGKMGVEQQAVNKKEIQYYKGKPDYLDATGKSDKTSESAPKKTEKKGVRFKLDGENQQKLDAKEKELKSQAPEKKSAKVAEKTAEKAPKSGDNHNADAE